MIVIFYFTIFNFEKALPTRSLRRSRAKCIDSDTTGKTTGSGRLQLLLCGPEWKYLFTFAWDIIGKANAEIPNSKYRMSLDRYPVWCYNDARMREGSASEQHDLRTDSSEIRRW